MKKVRWGIAGPGRIAHKFADALKNIECAELVAVASRFEDEARDFADKYGIDNVFVGYDDMASFDGVDAVYVSTPPHVHKDVALIYLNAKKHVLCEKSICVNAFQAMQLKECAEKNDVFLMEAMWMKFLPVIRNVKSIVESGTIGKIENITADLGWFLGDREGHRVFMNEFAGGVLLDIGVYGFHFINLIMNELPESIKSAAKIENDVDVQTGILMKFSSGAIANVFCTFEADKPRSAYIYGNKGNIYIPNFLGGSEFIVTVDGEEKRFDFPSIGEGFEEEILEANTCIINGKTRSDIHPVTSSIEILNQMDIVREQIGVKYPLEGE